MVSTNDRIPLAVPDLRGNERAFLLRCIEDNWVSSAGPDVAALEISVAAATGRAHGVATASGTAALHLGLLAAGVRPGDRVAMSDWTFAATANAALQAGATPVFVDVTEESWTLDAEALERAVSAHRPTAVVAVHALGHPADMDPILEVARAAGIPVVEDAAGALGARYRGRPAGGLGEVAAFSFNGNKVVTTGGGGMLVTDREAWAESARALSTQARAANAYRYQAAGFNYRMPNVNAALGLAQMERMEAMVAAKRAIAARYDAAFAGRDDLRPMPRCDWAESSCWLYSLRCGGRTEAEGLVAHLDATGIEARTFWEALSDQPPYASFPAVRSGVARALSGTLVSLPCSSHLDQADQERVIAAVAAWRGTPVGAAA